MMRITQLARRSGVPATSCGSTSDLAEFVEAGPFLEAFLVLIVIPLTLAWLTPGVPRAGTGQRVSARGEHRRWRR
ncbi:hypothetical protein P9A14_12545 [Gordonia hongkongensis]|jgi:hypothetical protein|nr:MULTISPECIES: hypothetical protein [Gordonia]MCF3941368.1 hypothetical protein [Gordonia tangerina]MCC3324667.1 hypothetical protein [Gordonia bronchialis]MCT1355393.1 hypothetical protein [Gordonia sp. p3-SID1431]MDF6103950.1 hypothetical protein [Gordonia hongkongensis]UPG66438.1 hypothetical protein MVF96_12950 [Gordonia hongkongensis]